MLWTYPQKKILAQLLTQKQVAAVYMEMIADSMELVVCGELMDDITSSF